MFKEWLLLKHLRKYNTPKCELSLESELENYIFLRSNGNKNLNGILIDINI